MENTGLKGGEMPEEKVQNQRPAIRTMKSDVQELLKTTKPSLVQLVEKEVASYPQKRFEEKPNRQSKKTVLLLIGLPVLLLATGAATFFLLRSGKEQPSEPIRVIPPPPFFTTEYSRSVEGNFANRADLLELMDDSVKEPEAADTVKRILIKLTEKNSERFANLDDFLDLYRMTPPLGFSQLFDPAIMMFSHHTQAGPRFGMAARSHDPGRTLRGMLEWESSLLQNFAPLFFGVNYELENKSFEDRSYRNIDWRFLKLSTTTDIGIGYTIFPAKNILVVATARETVEGIIDRLFNAR